jgi:hypothetical protein
MADTARRAETTLETENFAAGSDHTQIENMFKKEK